MTHSMAKEGKRGRQRKGTKFRAYLALTFTFTFSSFHVIHPMPFSACSSHSLSRFLPFSSFSLQCFICLHSCGIANYGHSKDCLLFTMPAQWHRKHKYTDRHAHISECFALPWVHFYWEYKQYSRILYESRFIVDCFWINDSVSMNVCLR